jgi:UDP-N-acetylmuramoyl-tripeptide--D-alanyl-D-alanine ligase
MNPLFNLFYLCSGITTDTRTVSSNNLFIALKGPNFNGNAFAELALEQGARYAIIDEPEYQTNDRIFVVENTLIFLQKLAAYHRNKFSIPVIGITGSNGKTTTKELVNAVLSSHLEVLCTKGNLNNHIGVPLTLLRLTSEHRVAIIEMGANHSGDIAELCAIASPTHGVITNIGIAHLEGFINFEGVLKAKVELYDSIRNACGTIVLNADDNVLMSNAPSNTKLFTYGTSKGNVNGKLIASNPFISFNYSFNKYHSDFINTNLVGKYNLYNFLSAVSFGVLFDVPFSKINRALADFVPQNNRSQVFKAERNTLIMDCYNANPSSMASALESFALLDDSQKLFIIGDMLELGLETENEHQAVANLCSKYNLRGYTVGPFFQKSKSKTFLEQFEDVTEAIDFFTKNSITDCTLLLKGSRGMGLERLQPIF